MKKVFRNELLEQEYRAEQKQEILVDEIQPFIVESIANAATLDCDTYESQPVEKYIYEVNDSEGEKVGEAVVFVYEEGEELVHEVEIEGKL